MCRSNERSCEPAAWVCVHAKLINEQVGHTDVRVCTVSDRCASNECVESMDDYVSNYVSTHRVKITGKHLFRLMTIMTDARGSEISA